jgi:uncharacterized iron-regulated membrane protein
MPNPNALLKTFRQIHLYIGIFISPAILFFALTGSLQTFNLHETTKGSDYKPPSWIVTLAQLHKKQTATVPVRKAPAPDAKPKAEKPAEAPVVSAAPVVTPAPAPKPPDAPKKSHLPMKIFFLIVALGLFTSTVTGIYMAYRFGRNKWVVTGLLVAGVVVPLVLLPF